jgi:hypothetical protein
MAKGMRVKLNYEVSRDPDTGVEVTRLTPPLKSANRRPDDKGWTPWMAARGEARQDKIAGSNFEQRLRWPQRGESHGWDE